MQGGIPRASIREGDCSGNVDMLSIQRTFPDYFANLIFVSVAVYDSGTFKGTAEVDAQRRAVDESAQRYVALARGLGWNSSCRTAEGLDPVQEATTATMATPHKNLRAFIVPLWVFKPYFVYPYSFRLASCSAWVLAKA